MSNEQQPSMGKCCVTGYIHNGEAKGKDIKLGSLDCYVTGTEEGKSCLLILNDAFGHKFINTRLVADTFAEKLNVPVYVPDILQGKPFTTVVLESFKKSTGFFDSVKKNLNIAYHVPSLVSFMMAHSDEKTLPVVKEAFEALKQKYEKIAVQGYCFGGKHVVTSAAQFGPVSIISTHPGNFALTALDEVKCPILFQLPEHDSLWKKADFESIDEKVKKLDKSKVHFYPKVQHGWAIRSDPNDEDLTKAKDEACQEAVDFIKAFI